MTIISVVSIICFTVILIVYLNIKWEEKKNSCKHKWEKADEERTWSIDNPGPNDQRYSHRKVILQCKNCGDIKTVKIC